MDWLTEPVTEIWPDLDPIKQRKATRWIAAATRLVETRFDDLQLRVEAGKLNPAVVADVIEAMVTRALERDARGGLDKLAYPEVSMEWGESGAAGSGSVIFLTKDELLLLGAKPTGGPFMIHTVAVEEA